MKWSEVRQLYPNAAWKMYKKLHTENRDRELYIFHINKEKNSN